ncbi:MAG: hypothetical protein IKB95_09465, partial [Bacteroidales bacterium]|nr:hypothetical protein [Bacteroidales bacterium]
HRAPKPSKHNDMKENTLSLRGLLRKPWQSVLQKLAFVRCFGVLGVLCPPWGSSSKHNDMKENTLSLRGLLRKPWQSVPQNLAFARCFDDLGSAAQNRKV